MAGSYLPSTDRGLLAWSANVVATLGPDPAFWGVGAELFDEFAAIQSTFAAAFEVASNPATRTRGSVVAKTVAAEAVRVAARSVAAIVDAQPDVTDADRVLLGLTVRAARSTRAAPSSAPIVNAALRDGRTVTVSLAQSEGGRRGRLPEGVSGAILFRCVGDAPAASMVGWEFVALTGRLAVDVYFDDATPPAAQVWFAAAWFSHRKELGPLSAPRPIHLAGGPVMSLGRTRRAA